MESRGRRILPLREAELGGSLISSFFLFTNQFMRLELPGPEVLAGKPSSQYFKSYLCEVLITNMYRMAAGLWGQIITLIGSRFTDKWFIALIVFALLTFICIFIIYWNQRKVEYLGDDAALRKVAFKGLRASTLQLLL